MDADGAYTNYFIFVLILSGVLEKDTLSSNICCNVVLLFFRKQVATLLSSALNSFFCYSEIVLIVFE